MADYEPVLVWLVRDSQTVAVSYRRRSEQVRFGMSVDEVVELAGKVFASWPWGKVRVGYEELRGAVGLFDVGSRCRQPNDSMTNGIAIGRSKSEGVLRQSANSRM